MDGVAIGILVAGFLNGLRHGVDFDHVAAITDISGSQSSRRRSLGLATLYAGGHALVVLLLGTTAVLIGARIPAAIDSFMGRVVGVTLLLLGGYVLYSVIRYGRDLRLQSRWMLLASGLKRLWRIVKREPDRVVVIEHEHEHGHEGLHGHAHPVAKTPPPAGAVAVKAKTHAHVHHHIATLPQDPLSGYSSITAFVIGMLHGVGAETPTQVLLFLTAAGIGSRMLGMLVLVVFLLGLVTANSVVAVAAAWGLTGGRRMPRLYVGMATITALFSLVLGASYVLGTGLL